MIYSLTAIGFTLGACSTVLIYTQTIHGRTQQLWLEGFLRFEPKVVKIKLTMNKLRKNYRLNGKSADRAPVFASYTLAFALELRKKHGKASVRI